MIEEILGLCRGMGASEDQEELLRPLIEAVKVRLEGQLKVGVSPVDCGSAFPLAVAMMAMDGLEGAIGGDRVASFTAGEVTVRKQSAGQGRSLSDQARRLLAPWLVETGFAFQGVTG